MLNVGLVALVHAQPGPADFGLPAITTWMDRWADGPMGRWVAEGTNDACWPDNEVQLSCQGCVTSSIYLRSMPLDSRLSNMAWLKHADRNCHQLSA